MWQLPRQQSVTTLIDIDYTNIQSAGGKCEDVTLCRFVRGLFIYVFVLIYWHCKIWRACDTLKKCNGGEFFV